MKPQVSSCLKQFHLKQHLNNANKEQASKPFCTLSRLKRVRLNAGGVFHQAKLFIIQASYVVALCIATAKKSHAIAETLVKPYLLDCAKMVLDDRACNKVKQVSISNVTIKSLIVEISSDIKIQLTSAVTSSGGRSLESPYVEKRAQRVEVNDDEHPLLWR